MNPLVPAPDTIPVAWGYLQFLLMLTFPVHLMLMNAMVGSTAIAVYAALKNDETMRKLAYELAKVIPFLIAFAVNMGVAALLFLQVLYGHFFYVSSILIAVSWLSVIPLLIIAYYTSYLLRLRFSLLKGSAAALVSGMLLIFLSVAFIYTNNMTMMLDPGRWKQYFNDPSGTLLNIAEPSLFPRYFHIMIGANAIGALFVALYAHFRTTLEPDVRAAAQKLGIKTFTVLTGFQLASGFIFLLSLPRKIMLLFLGGNSLATLLFLVALVFVISALAAGVKGRLFLSAGLAIPVVYGMASIRSLVRAAYLAPDFALDLLEVSPQYSPMFLFFGVLIAGIAAVGWLLRQAYLCFRRTRMEDPSMTIRAAGGDAPAKSLRPYVS